MSEANTATYDGRGRKARIITIAAIREPDTFKYWSYWTFRK
jgi:hypothetical protein